MNPPIQIRPARLEEIIDLRHVVLRAGLPRETAIFTNDDALTSRHYGAFVDGRAVGCVTLHASQWESEPAWQLRGMATNAEHRGNGLGTMLMEFLEADLLKDPAIPRLLWCNARVPAAQFYQRLGWTIVSDTFEIPTAGPHVRMVKRLDPSSAFSAAPR